MLIAGGAFLLEIGGRRHGNVHLAAAFFSQAMLLTHEGFVIAGGKLFLSLNDGSTMCIGSK